MAPAAAPASKRPPTPTEVSDGPPVWLNPLPLDVEHVTCTSGLPWTQKVAVLTTVWTVEFTGVVGMIVAVLVLTGRVEVTVAVFAGRVEVTVAAFAGRVEVTVDVTVRVIVVVGDTAIWTASATIAYAPLTENLLASADELIVAVEIAYSAAPPVPVFVEPIIVHL
jgi:hypothetical protein